MTHLDHKAEELRSRQAGEVLAHCREAFGDDQAHVICGDLNSFDQRDMSDEQWATINDLYQSRGWTPPPNPDSLVQQVLMRDGGYRDAFAEAGHGDEKPPRTCWTNTRLDYILLSPGARVRVITHATIEDGASDHLPVVNELEL